VALALSEPLAVAQKRIARARRLRAGLPLFKRAFARGDLSDYDVDQLVHATAGCNDADVLTRVQEQTLARRAGKTAKELRRYATRVLTRLDPAVAQKRARQARDDADVTVQPLDDGMARVVVDAPVEDAQIVKAYTDAYAARAKNTGDPRRTGVLRVEGISRLCADALMHERSTTGGRPVEIGIVIGVDTALGLNQLPAEVPAQGIVPRDVVAAMIATELPKLRLLVTDDSGHLAYRGTSSYRPTADQVAHVRARWVTSLGPGSQVPARRSDVDHLQEWPDGRTIVTNLAPFDRSWHNHKTRRSLHVTVDDSGSVIVTTVLGQSRTVTPYQYDAVTQTGQPTPF
jgi:hypothetical protein